MLTELCGAGKGPQKEYYLDLIKQKSWNHTQVITMWLTAENYPKFLGTRSYQYVA